MTPTSRRPGRALAVATLAAAAALGGCERALRDMYTQPRYDPGEASPLFADGKATRPPPPHAVAHAIGDLAAISSGRRGQALAAAQGAAQAALAPPPLTLALLQRGRERYTIFCAPCHSPLGDGDGPIVRHGFPAPPSFHQPRLRDAADRHVYDVITFGWGLMRPYADRVTAADRWAIVAYLRALQLSRHAPAGELPPALSARLPAAPEGGR